MPAIKATGFGLTAASSLTAGLYNTPVTGEQILVDNVRNNRNNLIKQRTGLDIFQHTGVDKFKPQIDNSPKGGRSILDIINSDHESPSDLANRKMNDIILEKRKTDPSWNDILTTDEIVAQAKEKVGYAEQVAADIAQRNPSGFSRVSGQFIGGMGGATLDVPNLLTLPISAPRMAASTAARQVLMNFASEAALQGVIQVAQIPGMKDWQEKLGKKYGVKEAVMDVAFAAGGAGFIRGIGEVGAIGIEKTLSRYSKNDPRSQNISHIIDEIEKNTPRTHQEIKDALKQVSREAYVNEQTPVPIKTSKEAKAHRDAVQSVVDNISSYKKPATELPGISKVITPRNELELEVQSRIVELDDLITSDKPEFDQSLQPRDRASRKASDVRIQKIAAELDPAQLGDSRLTNTGSPIVARDMMVESGNGRTMGLRLAYDQYPESVAKYKEYLQAQGHDITGFKKPVLIRQRISDLTPEQRRQFTVFSNEDIVDRMSTTERAMADAKLMTGAVISTYRGGDISLAQNAKFVRNFIDTAVAPAERNSFVTPKGELSQEGMKRLQSAMLAKAYNDSAIVQKIMEDQDNDIKTIGKVLMDLSGEWSNLRADIESGYIPPVYDINEDLLDAVRTIVQARAENKPITDYTGQSALFASNDLSIETRAIIAGLYDKTGIKALGYDKAKDFLEYYIGEVSKIQNGSGLFVQEPLTPFDIMNLYLERQGKSLSRDISSGAKREPLKKTSPMDAPGTHLPASKTSETIFPSSFTRKRATMPPSKRTGVVSSGDFIGEPPSIKVYHTSKDLATITKTAKELKPDLENFLKYITDGVQDASVYGVRLKETDSLNLKLGRGKTVQQVSDFIGGRIVVDTQAALDHVLSNLRKSADIMEIDNFLDGKKTSGYRAIHVQLKSDKGISAEVQIQPAPIRAVQDEAHVIYKRWQNVTEASEEKAMDLQKAKELFDEAWSKWEAQSGTEKPPLFDDNAYRMSEYREPVAKSPIEAKEADRVAASQAKFASLAKTDPDMMVTLDDGTEVRMADYAKMIKEDQKVLEALTTCRLE